MSSKHQFFKLCSAIILSGGAMTGASAITLGVPDCTDNSNSATCLHPNVVSLSGFRLDTDGTTLVSSGRCTGSVLKVTHNMLIVLTAGHCAALYSQNLANGSLVNVGVSFDPLIQKTTESTWGASQYILNGVPLVHKQFGPTMNSSNVQFDYGLVAFPLVGGDATTDGGGFVHVHNYSPVTLAPIGFLNSFVTNVTAFTNVGYGTGSVFNDNGQRNKPVTQTNFDDFGIREIADNSVFINFKGQDANLMNSSMNPAKGNNGTCGGDSGGPQFYKVNGNELIISVTSSGDSICRSTNITARLDIPAAQDFINQCAYAANSMTDYANCTKGCTTVSSKGTCQ